MRGGRILRLALVAVTALVALVASPTIASKEWAYRQYDQQVGINTLVLPGSDASVLRVKGTRRAIAVAIDGNGRHVFLDPRRGAAMGVCEAARNVSCAGGRPLGVTDCLNFGSPERPEILWQLAEYAKNAEQAVAIESLLGIEGMAAKVYFGGFAQLLNGDGTFDIEGRNRRPPR